ncbi:MAG: hypothetical protein J6A59_07405 [Lachnospiraceae bacterium]|nr:hypothetical protein [Lachnospiraceae bacterium]
MKKIMGVLAALFCIVTIAYLMNRRPDVNVERSAEFENCAATYKTNLTDKLNSENTKFTVAGLDVDRFNYEVYVSEQMVLMVESDMLKSLLSCSVLEYDDGGVIIMKGDNKVVLTVGSNQAMVNDNHIIDLLSVVVRDGDKLFIPLDNIAEFFSYRVTYDLQADWIDLTRLEGEKLLPAAYDMRDYGRVTPVRDQGRYGTCWAFASLGALETTLLPEEEGIFSTDHMSMNNSYNLDIDSGGEHTMSIAYLAAWQGPVYEANDPYGDGESNGNLKAVKHLEEALIINEKDIDVLKSAIFRYGAVETSVYTQMEYVDSISPYYSKENASYYYDGEELPNHDVVVVGWDDNYAKENFTNVPEGDGAFICKNSWGTEFGDRGYVYVSYYDANICKKSVVYTRVGDADNYDNIYQTDLLGWIGHMGFDKEEAYFANVYTAGAGEELAAVSFYATGKDTEFEVYVVSGFEDEASFKNRQFVTAGSTKYAGYYTVDFPEAIKLADNEKFAVVVKIKTPGAVHPIAIEYNSDERTENFDITDGEGYISLYGEKWHSAEETQQSNVCLKAFTNKVKD